MGSQRKIILLSLMPLMKLFTVHSLVTDNMTNIASVETPNILNAKTGYFKSEEYFGHIHRIYMTGLKNDYSKTYN